jgi:hydroxyacylglutathione hydrolase
MLSSYKVHAINAFNDNYIWAITQIQSKDCVVVDPGCSNEVISFLAEHNLTLKAILITHHHHDHVGGVEALQRKFPNIKVYGPSKEAKDTVLQPLVEGDNVTIESLGLSLSVLEVPGHTLGHIAYVDKSSLFCGDTLFAAGCGRMFEGTPLMFHTSLSKLADLPATTHVYCAHEYTLNNLKFAKEVEPHSGELTQRIIHCQQQRKNGESTIPSTIAQELATNPFLRLSQSDVIKSLNRKFGLTLNHNLVENFKWLRQWKDTY